MNFKSTNIDTRLAGWAKWAGLDDDDVRGHVTIQPFSRNQGGGLPIPPITDDEAMLISEAMQALRNMHPDEEQAVNIFYRRSGRCFVRTATILSHRRNRSINRQLAANQVNSGICFVQAYLAGVCSAA